MSSDALRKAFEAWLNPGEHAGNVSAWVEPGRYEKDTHQLAWLAWCAALSAPAPAPAEPPSDPLYDDAYLRGVALGFPQGDTRRWTLCRIADRIEAAAAPAAPAAAPAQAEPVAWQQRYIDPTEGPGLWQPCDDNSRRILGRRADYELRPLYAAPGAPGAPGAPQGNKL